MSLVLVTGGTGTLGQPLVRFLARRGHEVRVLSRRPGVATHVGDLESGVGVADAASGVELVVHAASDTRRLGRVDLRQTGHLLDAARDARHLLFVSIVGIDAIPFLYYRRKLACERLIAESGRPHTILRATQFHELIAQLMGVAQRLPVTPLPLDFRFQPVAAAEVARRVADLLTHKPAGRAPDFGGPQVLTMAELATAWRSKHGRPRAFVPVPVPGRVASAFREGRNTCPEHADGRETWAQFLEADARAP